jgi:hypothetical protein
MCCKSELHPSGILSLLIRRANPEGCGRRWLNKRLAMRTGGVEIIAPPTI